jgi:hypothetical protein
MDTRYHMYAAAKLCKGHATTTSALFSFASNHNTIISLLQEPTIEYTELPPTYPDFHIFTPVNE